MKIMYCPQCGGKVKSESIGWTCESCQGFVDMQGGFHPHKEESFVPPMTYECHEFEECEYNGQPECRLPDGMDCPHGLKADKPAAESWMDIEALIEKLNQYSQSSIAYKMGGEFADACVDAVSTLFVLQSENEKLRDELERVKKRIEIVEFQRDAAIKQLHGHCPACTHYTPNYNEGPCAGCKHEYYQYQNIDARDNWQWRGPHKED